MVWYSLVGDSKVTFKLDTGAEVTAITEETFKKLGEISLMRPLKALYGSAHQPLEVVGNFIGEIRNGCNSLSGDIFVVRGLKFNLLGLQALTSW